MPERDEVKVGTLLHNTLKSEGAQTMKPANELKKEDIKPSESRTELKARMIKVLERGVVYDRLRVDLPPHIYGEWVRNDALEIIRMQTLGFDIDREYAVKRALHNDGSDSAIIGDVIFMTCAKELKEVIDEIRDDQFRKINGKPGDLKTQREEKELADLLSNSELKDAHIKPIEESQTRVADKEAIRAAVEAADKQLSPT